MYFNKEKVTEEMTIALAHEVKNPLALIKANVELLELENLDNGYQKNFKVIKNEISKISAIISDFMLFCKPLKPTDTNDIVLFDAIKECMERYTTYNNIKFYFNCYCPIDDMKILGEHSKISILLANVYKNSIEAIQKNGVIQTTVYEKDKSIIVDIVDDGIGIDKKLLDKVHEPFFTNKEQGSGLGLPICNSIMKELGGTFEIFNNKDKGCTVRLTFKKD